MLMKFLRRFIPDPEFDQVRGALLTAEKVLAEKGNVTVVDGQYVRIASSSYLGPLYISSGAQDVEITGCSFYSENPEPSISV